MIEVEDAGELSSILDQHETVVVDFQALSWCVPCQRLQPHLEAASESSSVTFVSVDIDKAPWAVEQYNILSVPTVLLYRHGEFVKELRGRTAIKLLKEIEDA